MEHFKSPDVMRFLGQKVHGAFTGEIITSFKNRPEGVRVKHSVRGNSPSPPSKTPLPAPSSSTPSRAPSSRTVIRGLVYRLPAQATPRDHRRLSAKVSRQLRLLRAHGAIKKIPKTHPYRLTSRGLLLTAALQATRRANLKDLLKVA